MVYRFIPSEPHLATDNELVRDILLALLSSPAKVEGRRLATERGPEWPARRPKASGSGDLSSMSNFDKRSPNEPLKGKRLMLSRRRSASTGTQRRVRELDRLKGGSSNEVAPATLPLLQRTKYRLLGVRAGSKSLPYRATRNDHPRSWP